MKLLETLVLGVFAICAFETNKWAYDQDYFGNFNKIIAISRYDKNSAIKYAEDCLDPKKQMYKDLRWGERAACEDYLKANNPKP